MDKTATTVALALIGVTLIAYGIYQYSPPAMYIVVGGLLLIEAYGQNLGTDEK